jgi:uncharacterized protein YegL
MSATPNEQGGLQLLPFYLVCDESSSMAGAPIDAINESLPEVHAEIGSNPVVADKTRLGLIAFSDQASLLLPLADLSTLTAMPKLSASGGTDYKTAFDMLRATIDADVQQLKQAGHRVFRPAVFFLSDGYPNRDDWRAAHQTLTDPNWKSRPNILAFGFGAADENVIREVATVRAFMADGTMGPAQALREFAMSLVKSMVQSATSSAANPGAGLNLAMPDQVPGFTNISTPEI